MRIDQGGNFLFIISIFTGAYKRVITQIPLSTTQLLLGSTVDCRGQRVLHTSILLTLSCSAPPGCFIWLHCVLFRTAAFTTCLPSISLQLNSKRRRETHWMCSLFPTLLKCLNARAALNFGGRPTQFFLCLAHFVEMGNQILLPLRKKKGATIAEKWWQACEESFIIWSRCAGVCSCSIYKRYNPNTWEEGKYNHNRGACPIS